jgi:hypothetical protein
MNDFSEIERELEKLRPAPVGSNLVTRIEKALLEEASLPTATEVAQKHSTRGNWISLGLGLGLAAAAGFLMLARVNDNEPAKKQPAMALVKPSPNERLATVPAINPGQLLPAGLTEVVYHTQDEGLHFPDGATEPVRRMRYHTRETLRWQNAQTGASLRVSYPSEEVVLLPVSGQ